MSLNRARVLDLGLESSRKLLVPVRAQQLTQLVALLVVVQHWLTEHFAPPRVKLWQSQTPMGQFVFVWAQRNGRPWSEVGARAPGRQVVVSWKLLEHDVHHRACAQDQWYFVHCSTELAAVAPPLSLYQMEHSISPSPIWLLL